MPELTDVDYAQDAMQVAADVPQSQFATVLARTVLAQTGLARTGLARTG